MVAMNKESGLSTEAAMKYFVLGSLASGMLLYGISILYGVTGNIQMAAVAQALQSRHDIVPVFALVFILGWINI